MLSLHIPVRRQISGCWCSNINHLPCFTNYLPVLVVQELWVMRLIRTTYNAAIVCSFVPTSIVIPFTITTKTTTLKNRRTNSQYATTSYPIISFTKVLYHPFQQRGVRYYAKRTRTNNKDDVPIIVEDDNDTDDLYLLSSLSSPETSTSTTAIILNQTQSLFATSFHAPVMWKECINSMISCTRGIERKQQQQQQQKDNQNGLDSTEEDNIKSPEDDSTIITISEQQQSSSSSSSTSTIPQSSLIFVDGTLGGGGHSLALLESLLPGDIVFGVDVDPDALYTACQRLQQYKISNHKHIKSNNDNNNNNDTTATIDRPWFIPVPSNFADLTPTRLYDALMTACNDIDVNILSPIQKTVLQNIRNNNNNHNGNNVLQVDGILLDLGVSSYQIDTAERGFAFMKDGPLDMRMDRHSNTNHSNNSVIDGSHTRTRMTAADVCNELDISELRYIFKTYGDEPRARVIAESIVQRRPLSTTNDLYEAVAAVTPQFVRKGRRMGRMATMARIFQSLRIVVNQEDIVLERALTKMAPNLLRSGGRLVVLSYHSMEDRATKRIMRDGTISKKEAEYNNAQKDMYGNYIGEPKPFRVIGKPQKATIEEVELNPRARSATLRVAERV